MEEELLYRNHFFTDKQTDKQTAIVKPVYLQNFVCGGIQTYFQYGDIVEKWPPGGQNFMAGVTFSRPVVQYLMLKFEPCQLLTLKNDPGSHFSTGSLFNVTPASNQKVCVWGGYLKPYESSIMFSSMRGVHRGKASPLRPLVSLLPSRGAQNFPFPPPSHIFSPLPTPTPLFLPPLPPSPSRLPCPTNQIS